MTTRAVRVLVYKGFARFLRNRSAVALTFIVPVAMIAIFGEVFGLNRRDSGPVGIRLGVVNTTDQPAAARLVAALQAEPAFRVVASTAGPDGRPRPLTEADLRAQIRDRALRFGIVIVAAPGRMLGLSLRLLSNPQNEIEARTVNGLLQKTVFTRVPEMLGQSLQERGRHALGDERLATFNQALGTAIAHAFGGNAADIARALAAGDFGLARATAGGTAGDGGPDVVSRLLSLEEEQVVGREVKSPAATRVVGGWAVMFLMFALNSAATSLFEERKSGIFQRLLSGPVTRADILWSRFIFGVVLGLVQLLTIFGIGSVLYGIDVTSHFGNLALVSLATASACTAFGLLIASVAPSHEAAQGLATFLILTMSACGGAWFPVSFMPDFMQQVARFTLTYWAMDGFGQVLWAGNSLGQLLPVLGILGGITAGVMAVAIWGFRRGRLFD